MKRLHKENVFVMAAALAICITTLAFPEAGRFIKRGMGFGLAALLVIKGASRLQCQRSDALLAIGIFALFLLSKTIPGKGTALLIEICASIITLIFAITGLKLNQISKEQKWSRENNG